MLHNGLFEISYPTSAHLERETLLAVCRGGKLTASDPHGGVYLGEITVAESWHSKAVLTLNCLLPEGGTLVTGLEDDANRASPVAIHGVVDSLARWQTAVLVVDGEPIEVEIEYVGPLPT